MEVRTSRCEDQSSSPNYDGNRSNALNGKSLGQEGNWISAQDKSKVEDRRSHGEAISAVQAQVIFDPKESLEGSSVYGVF